MRIALIACLTLAALPAAAQRYDYPADRPPPPRPYTSPLEDYVTKTYRDDSVTRPNTSPIYITPPRGPTIVCRTFGNVTRCE